MNKYSGDCNTINDPMAKLCVPDIVRDMNVKVFNLLARINETKKVVWHETCKWVCRLTSAVCNNKQEWNENKCICKCKEDLIGKLVCDKGYVWNPSTGMCKCDKYCEIGQYLDYKNCVCRKKLIDDLIEQCTGIVDIEIKNGTSLPMNASASSKSETNVYLFLFVALLILLILLVAGFIYYRHKTDNKKFDDKIYEVAQLGTGVVF